MPETHRQPRVFIHLSAEPEARIRTEGGGIATPQVSDGAEPICSSNTEGDLDHAEHDFTQELAVQPDSQLAVAELGRSVTANSAGRMQRTSL